MGRKIGGDEVDKLHSDAYDAVVAVFRKTTQNERKIAARLWCQDHNMDFSTICDRLNIRPIDLVVAALIDVEHPLVTKPNGDLLQPNLIATYYRILQVTVTGESVPMWVGTGVVQAPSCTLVPSEREFPG